MPKLDRLARSVPDARAIGDALTAGGVRLSVGRTVYDPTDPVGKMLFNILATFASSRSTCCECPPAKEWPSCANGRLKGKQPKLSTRQRAHVLQLVQAGDHAIAELAELFGVSRATIYREIACARAPQSVR